MPDFYPYVDDANTDCEICGEAFKPADEIAEMYDPAADCGPVVCHAQCGLWKDLEVA